MRTDMKLTSKISVMFFLAILFSAPARAGDEHGHGHGHGHDEHEEEPEKGPHGGRLFEDGDYALELTIFEKGVPPRFRLYPFFRGKPLDPVKVEVAITLARFGHEPEHFAFDPEADYLTPPKIVEEPHSFSVTIDAKLEGRSTQWKYDSFEGRTELSDSALKVADIEIETAGPREISNDFRVYGKLLPNESKVAHLSPRFPGILKSIHKDLGDSVAKGELLAVVESNQGLQPYEIRSQTAGVVIKRHATPGEFVTESRELFVVADLSEVWADFQVYRDDFGAIEAGQKIRVELGDGKETAAVVRYVSPVIDEATQSKLVRAVLPNPAATLRPGLFVTGVLSSVQGKAEIAVKREAIQTFRDWNVVFLTDGRVFQAMPVELGRRDSKYVEILSGISPGARYVSRNSFIIKSDIEKSGASHDH